MATPNQEKFNEQVRNAEAIKAAVAAKGGTWSPEDTQAFEASIKSAQEFKRLVEQDHALEALKTWQQAPDGQSAVKNGMVTTEGVEGGAALPGWSGEAVMPNDGMLPEVSATAVEIEVNPHNGSKSYKAGEMYATGKIGDAKLKALKSGAYKDAFIQQIRMKALHGSDWPRHMKGDAMKVLQEGQDTAGGHWVPPDIRSDLVKKMATVTSIRQNAFAFTTGSDLVKFPKFVYTTDDNYTAGTQFSWTAEAPSSDISEATNPVAGTVDIPVHTETCAIIVTRALIEDNQFDLLGYLSMLLGESLGLGEEEAFVTGTGSGRPQGFTTHTDAGTLASSGGMYVISNVSAAITWRGNESSTPTASSQGLLGLEAALPPQYEAGAKWYARKVGYASIRGLVDSQLRPLWGVGEGYPNYANGYQASLLGYPIQKCQFMPAIAANSLSVGFGDMQGYYIADRVGLSVEVLRELRGLRDQIVIYARKRVGGQLVHPWKLKLLKLGTS